MSDNDPQSFQREREKHIQTIRNQDGIALLNTRNQKIKFCEANYLEQSNKYEAGHLSSYSKLNLKDSVRKLWEDMFH